MGVSMRTGSGKVESFKIIRGCLKTKIGDKSVLAHVDPGVSISASMKSSVNKLVPLRHPIFGPCKSVKCSRAFQSFMDLVLHKVKYKSASTHMDF
jgi:hypothetical protein